MKIKVFVREFMVTKLRLVRLLLILTTVFALISISITLLNLGKNKESADLEFCGIAKTFDDAGDMYQEIDGLYQFFITMDTNKDFSIYPVVSKYGATIDVSSFTNEIVEIHEFTDEYMLKYMKNSMIEGRLPSNSNEIVIGKYLKKYYQLNVGDELGNHNINLGNQISYKIVGILAEDTYNYSIIRQYNTGAKPNKMLIYFNHTQSKDTYKEISTLAAENGLNFLIGSQADRFIWKESDRIFRMFMEILLAMIFFASLMFVVMYLIKGTSRKIGILKALGIKDNVIISIYANGLFILFSISLLFSIGVANIIYYIMNNSISNLYGFKIRIYHYTWHIFIIQLIFMLVSYMIIYVFIKLRTLRISPKDCMASI